MEGSCLHPKHLNQLHLGPEFSFVTKAPRALLVIRGLADGALHLLSRGFECSYKNNNIFEAELNGTGMLDLKQILQGFFFFSSMIFELLCFLVLLFFLSLPPREMLSD